jgi:transposase
MGRSRGGLTTKIHALVDANGMPIAIKLTEGQAHDGRSAADMLDGLTAGQILLADRAYDSNALRAAMQAQGAWANIKPVAHRLDPPAFSRFLYRYRNLIERFFNKLKHYRAIATRYEKHAAKFLAAVKLASIRIWLRHNEAVAQSGSSRRSRSCEMQPRHLTRGNYPAESLERRAVILTHTLRR